MFLAADTVIMLAVLLSVVIGETFMSWVHADERKLFGEVPISWVFDGAKGALIIAFAGASARHAWIRFNERDDDEDNGVKR
jgi:integral membrane sensor domain MASE1